MSGGSIPYHLRTNKAIDRKIFFDLINSLELPLKIQEYKYISMGGPMLEDHNILHYEFGLTKLVSLERDRAAISRQLFNQPFGCIACHESKLHDYINNFDEQDSVVIWFDYTDTKWSSQFLDCESMLSNLKEFDVFKVTFNANPDALKTDANPSPTISEFKRRAMCDFVSENLTDNDVASMDKMAVTLSNIFESICEKALASDNLYFMPLLQFRYIDGKHQMLTISGVILPEEYITENILNDSVLDRTGLNQWVNKEKDWSGIHEINVPELTQKEKSFINQFLPSDGGVETVLDSIPFQLHKSRTKAIKMLSNYFRYYRYIPNFQKMSLS